MDMVRTIKYESDRVKGFGDEVRSVPGCEKLQACIQCGTCSGVCPLSIYMDHTPRQVMAMVRADFKNEVLSNHTIWLCASCYQCTVECPREIRITDIMYELKQRAIQEHIYPKRFTIPILAKEFYKMAYRFGRVTESYLVLILFLKTSWLELFRMWPLGLGLITHGRFPIRIERIKRCDELDRMMKVVDKLNIDKLHDELKKPRHAAAGGHA